MIGEIMYMTKNCLLCKEEITQSSELFEYDCHYCPKYRVEPFFPSTESANRNVNGLFSNNKEKIDENIHNIRGYLKEKEMKNEVFTITVENFQDLIYQKNPNFNEKLRKFINFINKNTNCGEVFYVDDYGKDFAKLTVSGKMVEKNLTPVVWGKNTDEVYTLLNELLECGYIRKNERGDYKITKNGYEYIEESQNNLHENSIQELTSVTVNNFFDHSGSQIYSGNFNKSSIIQTYTPVEKGDEASLLEALTKYGVSEKEKNELIKAIYADKKTTSPKKIGEKVNSWLSNMSSKVATVVLSTEIIKAISQFHGN